MSHRVYKKEIELGLSAYNWRLDIEVEICEHLQNGFYICRTNDYEYIICNQDDLKDFYHWG